MTLIAVLSDTHFGCRGDDYYINYHMMDFFNKCFWPEMEKRNIKHLIHLGDLVDKRKSINFQTLADMREFFLDKIQENQIQTIINVGNHDCYRTQDNHLNAVDLFTQGYDTITPVSIPKEISFGGTDFLILPWLAPHHMDYAMEMIKSTKAQICIGHLELFGFEMFKGKVADHGMEGDIFSKFDMVLSGHYHHKSRKGNIHYLGTPYEMTWADFEDPKGFHVFDTETRELEFIESPFKLFQKVIYDEDNPPEIQNVNSSFVKVVVAKKTDQAKFDAFIGNLEDLNPADLKVIDDGQNKFLENADQVIDESDNTLQFLSKYIQASELAVDKSALDRLFVDLYNEALKIGA